MNQDNGGYDVDTLLSALRAPSTRSGQITEPPTGR